MFMPIKRIFLETDDPYTKHHSIITDKKITPLSELEQDLLVCQHEHQ